MLKSNEDKVKNLDEIIQRGKFILDWEKTPSYKLVNDWINKECDINKVLKSPKEYRDEGIGYIRFGKALQEQFEIWKRVALKKQKELNEILEENDKRKK